VNEEHILTKGHVAKLVARRLQASIQSHHLTNCTFGVNPGAAGGAPKLHAYGSGKLSRDLDFYFDVRVGLYSDNVGIHLDLDEADIEAQWE
jgi:hypothetical protein